LLSAELIDRLLTIGIASVRYSVMTMMFGQRRIVALACCYVSMLGRLGVGSSQPALHIDGTVSTATRDSFQDDTKCEIVNNYDAAAVYDTYDFEIWYAVGARTDLLTIREMFQIEQLLYRSIKQEDLWCTKVLENRTLGPVAFTPGDLDVQTTCTFSVLLSLRCFVALTIIIFLRKAYFLNSFSCQR
jgi:hypothetical protein